jgi:predicted transposase YbfD/YdcC
MPASSSSPTAPVLGQLAALAKDTAEDAPGLLALLARAADPRHRRGIRYRLAVILTLAVCAVLAGACSFTAIAEWAADADEETPARLGVSGPVPSESTFRRTLQRLDADAFDELAGRWAARRTAPHPGARRVIAVDGKTLRGSGHGGQDSRHLLAALDHAHGVVLGQVEVDATTNEIPRFSALCDRIEITDAVVTADAPHAQHAHATYLHRRSAHYLLVVKRNQPGLHAQLAALPWRDVPVGHDKRERGHGRTERRTLKVTAVARGLAFPHAAQAIQITRRRKVKGKWSRETCYAVTSLTVTQAGPPGLPRSSAAAGASRTGSTGSAAWTSTRTALKSAPPAAHGSWHPCATGSHHPAAGGGHEHRRRPALPRTQVQPPSWDDHEVLTGLPGHWMVPYLASRTRSTSSVRVSLGISALCICSIRQAENVPRMTFSLMSLRTPAARSDARSRSLPPGRRTRHSSAA